MKLSFRGWQREVTPHRHWVTPVKLENGRYRTIEGEQSLAWAGPFSAFGKVNDLGLSGSFLVELEFEEKELRNWLAQYVKAAPASAVRLLAEMQAEAIIALSSQPPPSNE